MSRPVRDDTTGRTPAPRAASMFPRHIPRGYYSSKILKPRVIRRFAFSAAPVVTSGLLRGLVAE